MAECHSVGFYFLEARACVAVLDRVSSLPPISCGGARPLRWDFFYLMPCLKPEAFQTYEWGGITIFLLQNPETAREDAGVDLLMIGTL